MGKIKVSNYGVPYKGSKSQIAEWVVNRLPSGKHFYDLFAGGCAVTHAALLWRNFDTYHANDLNPYPVRLFLDAIEGRYAHECRWIGREEFEAEKATDGYIALCWSFGNKCNSYLYAEELEPWRRACHFAVFFNDYGPLTEVGCTGVRATGRTPWERWQSLKRQFNAKHLDNYRRWLLKCYWGLSGDRLEDALRSAEKDMKAEAERLRAYLREALKASGISAADVDRHLGTVGMSGHYFGASQWAFPVPDAYAKMQEIMPALDRPYSECGNYLKAVTSVQRLQSLESLQRLQRLQSLQRLQRLQRLESLQRMESLQRLETNAMSYDEVEIRPGSVIYCDIPYFGRSEYSVGAFDHERFYDWAERQTSPVVVSSYNMPRDRFTLVASIGKYNKLARTGQQALEREGLWVPTRQITDKIYKI